LTQDYRGRYQLQMQRLDADVALITGGGRGLGRAFAVALAKNGMHVAVAARSTDQLEETVRCIRAEGLAAIAVPTDITDAAAVRAMVETVETQLGPVDLLVNCAGAGPPFGPTWEQDASEWWRTLETNLKGPLLCSNAVLRGMTARRRGRIVNVASGAGIRSIPYMSAYVTSKAALIRLTEVLADEVRPYGVSIFAIQPGTVRTAMAEELLQSETGKQWLPWFQKIFDEGRDDPPEAGAKLVLYLASGAADALSGRFFAAPGSPADIDGRADEILRRDLHVLRVRFLD
jgi:NAD(P)-dependent dehydrogenase (short-subunit alcohol dehydrogenase family)